MLSGGIAKIEEKDKGYEVKYLETLSGLEVDKLCPSIC